MGRKKKNQKAEKAAPVRCLSFPPGEGQRKDQEFRIDGARIRADEAGS